MVTLVVPSFNREDYIAQTLRSLEGQSDPDWECLVVDDGSTDGTCEIVEDYASKDHRFRLLHRGQEPKGACSCRNIGLRSAKGEYVVFLDSDDLLTENALRDRVRALEEDPELDFVVSGTVVFREEIGDVARYRCFPHETQTHDLVRFLSFDQPWLTTGPTWRKSFLEKNQVLWDEKLPCWQDWFFHLDVLRTDPRYCRLLGFDSGWRTGGSDQISGPNQRKKSSPRNFQGFFDKLENYLQDAEALGGDSEKRFKLIYLACLRTRGMSEEAFNYEHPCRFRDYVLNSTYRKNLLFRKQYLPGFVRGKLIAAVEASAGA